MTDRVIALESCSAPHLLPVFRKRSRRIIELLHESPQLQLGMGLNFTHTRQKLSIQCADRRMSRGNSARSRSL
jgi:hypothetical protein